MATMLNTMVIPIILIVNVVGVDVVGVDDVGVIMLHFFCLIVSNKYAIKIHKCEND